LFLAGYTPIEPEALRLKRTTGSSDNRKQQ